MQTGVVNAEKLRTMKCPICGSRDKNVSEVKNGGNQSLVKVLSCNQCGYITLFGVSALALTDILTNQGLKSVSYYDEIVRAQHEVNHPTTNTIEST